MAKMSKNIPKVKRNPYRKKRPTVSSNVKLYVNKTIDKKLETKQVMYTLTPTFFNSAVQSTSEFYQVIPPVSIGSGQTGRIGESIQPIKIVVRGYINYAADTNQTPNELITRLFCFQDKSVRSWDLKTSISTNLLDSGGSGSQYTGTLINNCTPHNKDHFTWFKDKRHVILKPYGYTNTALTAISSMHSSMVHYFTITLTQKDLPKSFKYDASDYPTNFCPVIALGYSYAQNNSPDVGATQVLMAYTSTLYYKDA